MNALSWTSILLCMLGASACSRDDAPGLAGSDENVAEITAAEPLVPDDRDGKVRLGLDHDSAWALYETLLARASGGTPLSRSDMPDWGGLWTRVGNPFFDPAQEFSQLTTANLLPDARADLQRRRDLSAQGIEYDPISDCSPPGHPRWLAIPFLREFIVTPAQVWLTSETVNNVRRIYTDGRGHVREEDAYPLWYGDSIGFWHGHTLVIHTSQLRENIFHRNDPRHSEQLETVEVWQKTDSETILVDVWSYDPLTLVEPWHVQQTYKLVPNDDGYLRMHYWHCSENPNNVVIETDEGTSTFSDFTFTSEDD